MLNSGRQVMAKSVMATLKSVEVVFEALIDSHGISFLKNCAEEIAKVSDFSKAFSSVFADKSSAR